MKAPVSGAKIGMKIRGVWDWICSGCRREGAHQFVLAVPGVAGFASLPIDVISILAEAEVEHSLTGCNGRLESCGGCYHQEVA